MNNFDADLPVDTIFSGKLRRYHGMPIWRQLLHPFSIVWPNLRDMLYVVIGTLQSLVKLLIWRPDVIFTKGGFVCLPIGFAARILKITLVIHDSDAHPGLTNRILSRWAEAIATGAPLKYYQYPPAISRYVGIPINATLEPPSPHEQDNLKLELVGSATKPLVVITGGGLGARRINNAAAACLERLRPSAFVVLISGTAQYDELRTKLGPDDDSFQLHGFLARDMAKYLAAADIVVTRAGMTTILELAALARPTILIPNGLLTGGHQLKNAAVYAEADAVEVLDEHLIEATPQALGDSIEALLHDVSRRQSLSAALHQFARPAAARQVADMIITVATQNHK